MVTKPTFKELQKKFEMLENELVRCRQREETYRSLVESSSDSLYMVDKNCRYLFANNSYLVRHGVSTENMIGRSYGDFHSKGQEIIFAKNITEAFDTGNYSQQEHKSEKGDKYFLRTFSPVRQGGPEGEITAVVVISLEITARKLIDDALQESETKYRALMETTLSSSFVVQGEKFSYVNPAFERLSGYTLQDLEGLKFWDLVHPDFRQLVKERGFARQKHENIPARYEFKYVTKSGEVGWIDYAGTYIEFEGKPALLASGFDITDRKRIEDALRQSEEKYRTFIETIQDGYYEIDLNGKYTFVNDVICEHLQYSREELIEKDNRLYQTKENAKKVYQKFVEVYMTGNPVKAFEMEVIRKDGTIQISEVSISLIRNTEGTPISFRGTSRDITGRKQMEEALRQSEEKYRTILEDIQEGYFEDDLAGNFTFFNDTHCRIMGYPRKELMGMNNRQYMDKEESKKVFQAYNKVYTTGEPNKGLSWQIKRKDGVKRYFEGSVSLLKDSSGKPKRFRGIAHDITERKQAEEKLQQILESLRKAVGTTIQVLITASEARDPYTAGHQKRVADLACAIATEMGLAQEKIEGIRMAGSIHDIGKLSIPAEILVKPTSLSEIEFSLIKEHAQSGYEMLKDVESPWPLAEIVYQHHERMNGSGYPRNLKGNEILMESRILAVADVVEAMASHRPYRPTLGIEAALEEIEKNKGILYDDAVADACLRLFREKGYQLI